MDIAKRLEDLGWNLPAPPKPIAAYVPGVRSGNLLIVSGQLPLRDGKLMAEGRIPSVISIEAGQKAAGQAAVNSLAIVGAEVGGDWERLVRVVRVGVFVQADDGFAEVAKVANGASELLQQVMGEMGRHARATVGVNALPLNAAVEVECWFEVR
jgi:enamine deaminase RidA (YjgF/YER057c/UK114 family)